MREAPEIAAAIARAVDSKGGGTVLCICVPRYDYVTLRTAGPEVPEFGMSTGTYRGIPITMSDGLRHSFLVYVGDYDNPLIEQIP